MLKKQKHSQKLMSKYIIVAPPPFRWKVLTPLLKHPDLKLIFVDGGLIHYEKFLLKLPIPTKKAISMGDGDSSSRHMNLFKSDQNLSDLSYCLNFLTRQKNVETFMFVGFLGGRVDHQFFNLGEISRFVKKNKGQVLLEDKVKFLPKGLSVLNIKGLFSLGSFEDNKVKISGACLYQSHKWLSLPILSSRGLSNRGHGKIEIESLSPLAIFYS